MDVVGCQVPTCEWRSAPFDGPTPPNPIREDVVLHVWMEHPAIYAAAKEAENH